MGTCVSTDDIRYRCHAHVTGNGIKFQHISCTSYAEHVKLVGDVIKEHLPQLPPKQKEDIMSETTLGILEKRDEAVAANRAE